MEVGISRRAACVGGIVALCGVVMPQVVVADEAKQTEGALSEIRQLISKLSDDELLELEEVLVDEKEDRGVKSFPLGTGTYVSGVDIDPGLYSVRVRPFEPDGCIYVTFSLAEYSEESDEWKSIAWDLVSDPVDYNFTMRDGVRLKVDISDGKCTIFPAKKISFSE